MSELFELPLLPLKAVAFPDGLVSFTVVESRFLSLIESCIHNQAPLGLVAFQSTVLAHTAQNLTPAIASIGLRSEILSAKPITLPNRSTVALHVRCLAKQRFTVHAMQTQSDGLYLGRVTYFSIESPILPPAEFLATLQALAHTIAALKAQGKQPFLEPYQLNNAGWVANRWCELLPISLQAKQRLMELADPLVRLGLVNEYLKAQKLIAS